MSKKEIKKREKVINCQWYENGGAVVPESGSEVFVVGPNGNRICMEGDIQSSDMYWVQTSSLCSDL